MGNMSIPCISGQAGCPLHKNHLLIQQRSTFQTSSKGKIFASVDNIFIGLIFDF
jgi:hypothetical protein